MKGFDAFAGVIKSGGKTRRAAKMVILNADHPDILDFIELQGERGEEGLGADRRRLRRRLQRAGGAYDSIVFQNANHSVRVTDDFMQRGARRTATGTTRARHRAAGRWTPTRPAT